MPNYYNPYQQIYPNQESYPVQQQTQPQIQNGGFVSAPNESFARNYPVRQGMSVTFKDETAPYIYTKTMGFSQLDRPIFDKYRLIKEDAEEEHRETVKEPSPLDEIRAEIDHLWGAIEDIKSAKKSTSRHKDDGGND